MEPLNALRIQIDRTKAYLEGALPPTTRFCLILQDDDGTELTSNSTPLGTAAGNGVQRSFEISDLPLVKKMRAEIVELERLISITKPEHIIDIQSYKARCWDIQKRIEAIK